MSELKRDLDLCTRCKNLKSITKNYEFNEAEKMYAVRGMCDRCSGWSLDLWPMTLKDPLQRLAEL